MKIVVALILCVPVFAQQQFDPTDLIDRADLSDPVGYVQDINELSKTRLNYLRTMKGKNVSGLEWATDHFSFKAMDFPEALDLPTVIDAALIRLRIQSEDLTRSNAPIDKITKIEHDLLDRGFTHDEMAFFKKVALTENESSFGLHPAIGQAFRERCKAEGFDIKNLKESLNPEKPNLQVISEYYEIYLAYYTDIVNHIFGTFLGRFSLRSRRVLLSYSYEKCLHTTTATRPSLEPTIENWQQVYLPASMRKEVKE